MLYKYACDLNRVVSNIKLHSLYFNTTIGFNDPFDTYPVYDIDEQQRKNIFVRYENEHELDSKVEETFSCERLAELQRWQDKMSMPNSKYGFTCFSKQKDIIIMWSHYANSHKGVCLGFDISDEGLDSFFDFTQFDTDISFDKKLFPIQYKQKEERPVFQFINQTQTEFLNCKYEEWAYEKEYRIMLMANHEGVFPRLMKYQPERLREVNFGANTSWEEFEKYYNELKCYITSGALCVNMAFLDKHNYQLNFRGITVGEFNQLQEQMNSIKYFVDSNKNSIKSLVNFSEYYGEKQTCKYWKTVLNSLPASLVLQLPLEKCFDSTKKLVPVFETGLLINYVLNGMYYLKSIEKTEMDKERI